MRTKNKEQIDALTGCHLRLTSSSADVLVLTEQLNALTEQLKVASGELDDARAVEAEFESREQSFIDRLRELAIELGTGVEDDIAAAQAATAAARSAR